MPLTRIESIGHSPVAPLHTCFTIVLIVEKLSKSNLNDTSRTSHSPAAGRHSTSRSIKRSVGHYKIIIVIFKSIIVKKKTRTEFELVSQCHRNVQVDRTNRSQADKPNRLSQNNKSEIVLNIIRLFVCSIPGLTRSTGQATLAPVHRSAISNFVKQE